jgi:tripartite-type tricarboxylate transporter receptor subunit TctC
MGRLGALLAAAIAASLHVMGSAAAQQAYPERTVRFILPYGAASASDTTARLFADRLSAKWGKPVVVENRPGGDGIVSMQAFVAANDDHTLWFGPAGASTVLPYQHDTLPIDPYHDLNPIVSVSDVVLARSEPGKLNAAAASGISDFLLFGFFKNLRLEVAHVPYRDIMQAPGDLAEGRIQVLSSSLAVPQPLAHSGRLKILVVTSRQRAPGEPDIPTAEEAGYPALTFESVGGVFGPRGMPETLRKSIAADFRAVSTDPAIAERLASFGTIMDIRGPAEFAASVQEQREKLAALAKTLGIKAAQ